MPCSSLERCGSLDDNGPSLAYRDTSLDNGDASLPGASFVDGDESLEVSLPDRDASLEECNDGSLGRGLSLARGLSLGGKSKSFGCGGPSLEE